jgi:cephalosporin-C deacetylase
MPNIVVRGTSLSSPYPFDPTYDYSLTDLLAVEPPVGPPDFGEFWRSRFARALQTSPRTSLTDTGRSVNSWRIMDLTYLSTGDTEISGWALVPENGVPPKRGFIAGHGYGGRTEPDIHLPFQDAVIFFPCLRGLGRSVHNEYPADPNRHVVHEISDPHRYVLGGCVDDLWLAVSALLEVFPSTAGSVGVLGVSFSGGITALAAPWDSRIARAHVEVPTFGHQTLRLSLPTVGSGAGVQAAAKTQPLEVARTLGYFDAAIAARHMRVPIHLACACFDPAVAPPGQFAIHNAVPPNLRELTVLTAGHHPFPGLGDQEADVLARIHTFFSK